MVVGGDWRGRVCGGKDLLALQGACWPPTRAASQDAFASLLLLHPLGL